MRKEIPSKWVLVISPVISLIIRRNVLILIRKLYEKL